MFFLDFSGQLALVTGGTRGIGRQIVEDLIVSGAKVITTGTKENSFTDMVEYIQADFRDSKSVDRLISQLSNRPIDILINNAGINELNYIESVEDQDIDDIFNVNLKVPIKLLSAIAPEMMRRLYGRVVNISSVFGIVSKEMRSIYSVSKFGINGLTKTASIEFAKHGILVNSVSPGFIETDLTKSKLGEEGMKEKSKQIPMNRLGSSEEVSKAVLFLSSNLNTYITGHNLVIDGGFIGV